MIRVLILAVILSTATILLAEKLAPSTSPATSRPSNPLLAGIFDQLVDPNGPFALVVDIRAKPGQGDALEAAFVEHVRMTRTERGLIAFDFNRSAKDRDHFVLYERWTNIKAVEAHFETPWMSRVMLAMQKHALPPEPKVFTIAAETPIGVGPSQTKPE
jgi:quinol monooxygenase YgiN